MAIQPYQAQNLLVCAAATAAPLILNAVGASAAVSKISRVMFRLLGRAPEEAVYLKQNQTPREVAKAGALRFFEKKYPLARNSLKCVDLKDDGFTVYFEDTSMTQDWYDQSREWHNRQENGTAVDYDSYGAPMMTFVAQRFNMAGEAATAEPVILARNYHAATSDTSFGELSEGKFVFLHTDPMTFNNPTQYAIHLRVFSKEMAQLGHIHLMVDSTVKNPQISNMDGDAFSLSWEGGVPRRFEFVAATGEIRGI